MGADLVVLAASSVAVLASTITSVAAWLKARGRTQRIKITLDGATLELDANSPADAERIIKAFIARSAAEERETGK